MKERKKVLCENPGCIVQVWETEGVKPDYCSQACEVRAQKLFANNLLQNKVKNVMSSRTGDMDFDCLEDGW